MPTGDLLGYVTDLELTSLVAMVDPPRDESKAAVSRRPERPHPGADGHRRRCDHRCGDREATGHSRFRHARHGVRRAERRGTAGPDRRHRRRRAGRARAQGAARRDAQEEGRRRRHDRRRRERRARDQGRRHRHRHGLRHAGGQERQPHDPFGRQFRHDHARGRAGPDGVRQPQQVHPFRDHRTGRVHHHVPRRQHLEHRGRDSRSRPRRSCTSTSWSTHRSASRSAWTRRPLA